MKNVTETITGNKAFAEQCDQILVMENGMIKQQ